MVALAEPKTRSESSKRTPSSALFRPRTRADAYPRFSGAKAGLRFYFPETGTWLSRDPVGESGGLNLYGFLENNTPNASDAVGLAPYVPDPGGEVIVEDWAALVRRGQEITKKYGGEYKKTVGVVGDTYSSIDAQTSYRWTSANSCCCDFWINRVVLHFGTTVRRSSVTPAGFEMARSHEAAHRELDNNIAKKYVTGLTSYRRCCYVRGRGIFARRSVQSKDMCHKRAQRLEISIENQAAKYIDDVGSRFHKIAGANLQENTEQKIDKAIEAVNAYIDGLQTEDWHCRDTISFWEKAGLR